MLNPSLDAAALHACLRTDIPWRLYCYDNRQPPEHRAIKLRRKDHAAMSPEQRQDLQGEVLQQARDQFSTSTRPSTSSRATAAGSSRICSRIG